VSYDVPRVGKYTDRDGRVWDVEQDFVSACYRMRSGELEQRVPYEFMHELRAPYLPRLGDTKPIPPLPTKSVRDRLVATRSQRWRHHMVRMQDKEATRHFRRAAHAGIVVAWIWGTLAVVMVTVKLVGWLSAMVLG
jgi:hypothetical protein